ncbi:hypothetical protein [Novosphingobium sp.]|uniref:hypothetical protein n=1 Tax=Novosphingobium sp. TaxID=1874826 RepID=UPI0025E0E388|nr:hypothetical protein [Novosphingobium sp.]
MATSLNRAAEHRAAMNWIGMIGPLACSGLIVGIVAARSLMPWSPASEALADKAIVTQLIRTLFAAQLPLVWLFAETTAWRRYAPMQRGRKVLALQALALAAAIGFCRFAGI